MKKLRNKPTISLSGAIKPHRDASLFYIACEGEKTEPIYFGFSFLKNSRVKIKVLRSKEGMSAPTYILENLKAEISSVDLKDKDQLWLVIDKDDWPYEGQLREVKNKKVKNHNINVALSNPCFELFLYLHFEVMPTKPIESSQEMIQLLRNSKGGYKKKNLQEDDYSLNVNHAISESLKTEYGVDGFPKNPGTDVGKLVKMILGLKPKRDC